MGLGRAGFRLALLALGKTNFMPALQMVGAQTNWILPVNIGFLARRSFSFRVDAHGEAALRIRQHAFAEIRLAVSTLEMLSGVLPSHPRIVSLSSLGRK